MKMAELLPLIGNPYTLILIHVFNLIKEKIKLAKIKKRRKENK